MGDTWSIPGNVGMRCGPGRLRAAVHGYVQWTTPYKLQWERAGNAHHLHTRLAETLMEPLLKLSRAIDTLNTWIGKAMIWLIFASTVISAVNATVRKLFNFSSNAYLEVQWYLFAWAFLCAAGYTLFTNEHVRIDVLNAQSQVFETERELAQARYDVLLGLLQLKQAAGTLTEEQTLDQLRLLYDGMRPVRILALGYGPETDLAGLTRLADVTGGLAFQGLTEQDAATLLARTLPQL